jgi:hypothetical protein
MLSVFFERPFFSSIFHFQAVIFSNLLSSRSVLTADLPLCLATGGSHMFQFIFPDQRQVGLHYRRQPEVRNEVH